MTMVSRKNVTAAVRPFWMHVVVSLHYIHSLKSRQPSECDPRPGRGEWRLSLVLFLASERACRVNVHMVGQYCYQGYPGKGQQHRYTTLTNTPPRVKRVSTQSYFIVHAEWLWTIVLLTLAAPRGVTDLNPCLYPS